MVERSYLLCLSFLRYRLYCGIHSKLAPNLDTEECRSWHVMGNNSGYLDPRLTLIYCPMLLQLRDNRCCRVISYKEHFDFVVFFNKSSVYNIGDAPHKLLTQHDKIGMCNRHSWLIFRWKALKPAEIGEDRLLRNGVRRNQASHNFVATFQSVFSVFRFFRLCGVHGPQCFLCNTKRLVFFRVDAEPKSEEKIIFHTAMNSIALGTCWHLPFF